MWLERTPDKREVSGSTPLRPMKGKKGVEGRSSREDVTPTVLVTEAVARAAHDEESGKHHRGTAHAHDGSRDRSETPAGENRDPRAAVDVELLGPQSHDVHGEPDVVGEAHPGVPAEARGTRTRDDHAGSDVDADGLARPEPQPRANANRRALTGLIGPPEDRLTERRYPECMACAPIGHLTELPRE